MFACNGQFSMHQGRQCAAPNGLPHAGPGDAPKGASPGLGGGAKSFFSVVLCWQNVKICEYLLAMPSFQCIGGASVPAPDALSDAGPGGAPKTASPGLGRGADLFFCIVLCLQNVKFCACLLAMPSFQCIRGWQRATPNGLPDAGPGGAPNGASPGLGGRAEPLFFFRIVFAKRKNLCMCSRLPLEGTLDG